MISVRYIVSDVDEAVTFYRDNLNFKIDKHNPGKFAALLRDELTLYLSAPGAGSGGQAGGDPKPGGWNRFSLEVEDVEELAAALREAGVVFRNDVVTGVGGKQVLVEDPSGNPVELFQPTRDEARLDG